MLFLNMILIVIAIINIALMIRNIHRSLWKQHPLMSFHQLLTIYSFFTLYYIGIRFFDEWEVLPTIKPLTYLVMFIFNIGTLLVYRQGAKKNPTYNYKKDKFLLSDASKLDNELRKDINYSLPENKDIRNEDISYKESYNKNYLPNKDEIKRIKKENKIKNKNKGLS